MPEPELPDVDLRAAGQVRALPDLRPGRSVIASAGASTAQKAPSGVLPRYLTPQQVADALAVHERTVRRWAEEDATMPVTRLGKVIRFERAALLRWLERKKPRQTRSSAQAAAQERASVA